MTLTPKGYIPRLVDEKLDTYLKLFGAVSLEGPKWCGKTWTALSHAESVFYVMDPARGYQNRKRAELDPALILEGDTPRVLDEWQEVPGIWDAVRYSVDQRHERGRYILTGSVTPPKKKYRHSGAGRIARLEMRSMSLTESKESSHDISLCALLSGEGFDPCVADIRLRQLARIIARGGWPEMLLVPSEDYQLVSRQYLKAISENDLFDENTPQRNPEKLNRLLQALGRNNATLVNDATLLSDFVGANGSSSEEATALSRVTMSDYLSDLRRIFVIEEIPAWSPNIRSRTRIRQAPKRMFTDPSLACAALGANSDYLIQDLNTLGFMFENLCLRDLAIYARQCEASVFHYRDNADLEIDAIVEMPDGSWGAFEIKLGEQQVDEAAGALKRFQKKMIEAHVAPPLCLVVITGGGTAYQRDDGIAVIPITALGP